ncbi:hemojuvelin [Lampris incognitus]|uniref:hemojuvelin n=1 Tax=Lampris incognitus TaxID=2546036 RepID=UPI0024B512F0|nr:hemojuvelin [Lampris incognitus]
MGTPTPITEHAQLPWKHNICVALLLLLLFSPEVWASCNILRCNSDFVAATLDLGNSGGGAGGGLSREAVNTGYCSALRSYATCTKRTARACRGDLAYHSAVQGIEDLLIQYRCPRAGPTAQPRPPPQAPISGNACFYEKGFLTREGRVPEYLYCSVFGDPHIRTFNDEFQTCTVQGAWPLIDNEYLYVQVTSTPMRGGAYATALTKITIIFKNWQQCIEQQLYQAELDDVPAAFVDGSVWSGEQRGQRSLVVRSQNPGRHVEIHATHIGTVLVVRQSGRSLGFSVRSPRTIVEAFGPEQDLQLCVWGCPASQQLNFLSPPHPSSSSSSSLSRPTGRAQTHCAALLPTPDIYYQACVFDLLATGDLNASMASVAALEDAKRMMTDRERIHLLLVASALPHSPLPTLLVPLAALCALSMI